jgi:uncharacterized protein involved in outer membrane biogenesis
VPLLGLLLALAVQAGLLREAVIHAMAARAQRAIRVRGPMQIRLLTRHPRVRARAVEIDNPPWTPRGSLGEVRDLDLAIDLPWFGQPFTIDSLTIDGATLTLSRDKQSLANWQWVDPRTPGRRPLPTVRHLAVLNTHVNLNDELRDLHFVGDVATVGAPETDPTGSAPPQPFHLSGHGELNGDATSIELEGDPLRTASGQRPYHYSFRLRSEQGQIAGRGRLPEPFYIDRTQGTFESSGKNLETLHQLAGVRLIPTGPYRLNGEFVRVGMASQFHQLEVTTGDSEVRGEVAIDSSTARSRIVVALESPHLRMQDLGAKAAAPTAGAIEAQRPASPPSWWKQPIKLAALRRSETVYVLHAARLELSHYAFLSVRGRLQIERGKVTLDPLVAGAFEGQIHLSASLDARDETPAYRLEMNADDVRTQQLDWRSPMGAPIDAGLSARIALRGSGRSPQEMAARATGSARIYLSSGQMRASLAELAGLDLRGLALTLEKSAKQTAIHCGEADLVAQDGVLSSRSLLLDTDRMLIEGTGQVNLADDSIDLTLRGYPQGVRVLRLRSAIRIEGTLPHPSVSVDTRHAKLSLIDVGSGSKIQCVQGTTPRDSN